MFCNKIHVKALTVGLKVSCITSLSMSPLAQHRALYFSWFPSLSNFSRSCHVDRITCWSGVLSWSWRKIRSPSDRSLPSLTPVNMFHSSTIACFQPSCPEDAIAFLTVGFLSVLILTFLAMNWDISMISLSLTCNFSGKHPSSNTMSIASIIFSLEISWTPLTHTLLAFILHALRGSLRSVCFTSWVVSPPSGPLSCEMSLILWEFPSFPV